MFFQMQFFIMITNSPIRSAKLFSQFLILTISETSNSSIHMIFIYLVLQTKIVGKSIKVFLFETFESILVIWWNSSVATLPYKKAFCTYFIDLVKWLALFEIFWTNLYLWVWWILNVTIERLTTAKRIHQNWETNNFFFTNISVSY